jgi:hypothetical protein
MRSKSRERACSSRAGKGLSIRRDGVVSEWLSTTGGGGGLNGMGKTVESSAH